MKSGGREKRSSPESATTDIYCEVECVGNHEKPQHRGTPTWDGHQLEIDGNVYPPASGPRSRCFLKGGPLASNPNRNLVKLRRPEQRLRHTWRTATTSRSCGYPVATEVSRPRI
jgi:hypothetical protein